MNCKERQPQILLYAAGLMEDDDARELRAHLAEGCPGCLGAFAEAQAILAAIPQTLDPVAPPPGLRDRLMERIAESPAPLKLTEPRPAPSSGRTRWISALTGGAIAALVAIVATIAIMRTQTTPKGGISSGVEDVRYVSLHSDEQPGAHGRILWDADHHQWHISVFRLKPPGPGKVYELWFITDDQKKIPGPTFNVDASGHASLVANVPANIGPLALAAITDEPAPGVQIPTGSIQLVGQVKTP